MPGLMMTMLDALAVPVGASVLELGTATGYNAALLAELVGQRGLVVTVESKPDLAAAAAARARLDAQAHVSVRTGDAGHGAPEQAPYQRIVATVGCARVPPAWWDQLEPAGRVLVPLAHGCTYPLRLDVDPRRLDDLAFFLALETKGARSMRLTGGSMGGRLVAGLGVVGRSGGGAVLCGGRIYVPEGAQGAARQLRWPAWCLSPAPPCWCSWRPRRWASTCRSRCTSRWARTTCRPGWAPRADSAYWIGHRSAGPLPHPFRQPPEASPASYLVSRYPGCRAYFPSSSMRPELGSTGPSVSRRGGATARTARS